MGAEWPAVASEASFTGAIKQANKQQQCGFSPTTTTPTPIHCTLAVPGWRSWGAGSQVALSIVGMNDQEALLGGQLVHGNVRACLYMSQQELTVRLADYRSHDF